MFLFCLLLLPLSISADLFPLLGDVELRLNKSAISPDCWNDTVIWFEAVSKFSLEFAKCVTTNCSVETKKEMGKNFYALKQLDAFGHLPAGFLDITLTSPGSVYECKEVGDNFYYQTQYCYLERYLNKECKPSYPAMRKAVCMPQSCTKEDILEIFHRPLLPYCAVECLPEKSETNTFFWIFSSFMLALCAVALIATILDYSCETLSPFQSIKKITGVGVLLMFSFYTNGATILDVTPAKEGHLRSVDCIRFISMLWVVAGHVMEITLHNDNLYPLGTIGDPHLVDTLTNAYFSVDTFFALSGIMVAYIFFKAVSKNRNVVKNPFTWILFYVHRYIRLTPPYMLFICFYIAFVPLLKGLAVIDLKLPATVEVCKKYWWKNLLYINNFDEATDCYGITWYLACDFQIYMVAPIFLICFYFHHLFGFLSIILSCAGSIGYTYGMVYKHNLQVTQNQYKDAKDFAKYLYLMPWVRCTPYLIGLATGYILANKPKRITKRVKWYPLLATALWIISLAIAIICVYGIHGYLSYHKTWNKFQRATYYSFSRVGWAFFVCWVVLANFYGYGGPIAKFMEHPQWQPLGRLSFTAYLVHRFVEYYFFDLLDKPIHFPSIWQQFLGYTLPITVMSYVFAFVWSCLCEIPMGRVEKFCVDQLMGQREKPHEKEEKVEENWSEEQ